MPPHRHRRQEPNGDVPREAWTRLAVCTAAAAVLQLDGTLITVALPAVAHGLDISKGASASVLSAYFGAYALLLLPGGMLVDRFGVRRLALVGLALFGVGAVAGAVASSLGSLIASRLIQGAGAGLVSPAALAGAISGFPPERRGVPLGIWGASAGIANILGPLLGGVLTVALGWRADWWALAPLSLMCAWAIISRVPASLRNGASTTAHAHLNREVVLASFVAAVTFAVMIGPFYLAEQYLQATAGYSALAASGVLVLVALLVAIAAPVAGRLVDSRGERVTALLGFASAGLGLGLLGIPGMPLRSAVTIALLVPIGLGLGLLFVPASRAALNSAPLGSHGRVSAVLSIGRLLGAAAGAAAAGAAISGGLTASTMHEALLVACGASLLIGAPAAGRLRTPADTRVQPVTT